MSEVTEGFPPVRARWDVVPIEQTGPESVAAYLEAREAEGWNLVHVDQGTLYLQKYEEV